MSFTFNDFCAGAPNGATNVATPGGTFAFNPPPGDGAFINPTTGEITGAIGGTTYFVESPHQLFVLLLVQLRLSWQFRHHHHLWSILQLIWLALVYRSW